MQRSEVVKIILINDLLRCHRDIDAVRKQLILGDHKKLSTDAQAALNIIHDLATEYQLTLESKIDA